MDTPDEQVEHALKTLEREAFRPRIPWSSILMQSIGVLSGVILMGMYIAPFFAHKPWLGVLWIALGLGNIALYGRYLWRTIQLVRQRDEIAAKRRARYEEFERRFATLPEHEKGTGIGGRDRSHPRWRAFVIDTV